jgi:hypothetical protein
MDVTDEEGVIVQSTVITTVEVDGSSYFVVDRNMGNGDRRSDGQKMVDFCVLKEGERAKKQRVFYDPSQGCVRPKSKVLKSVLSGENVTQLNEDSTTRTIRT